jgi:hypothetical protein
MRAEDSIERINALLALYRESHYDVNMPDGATATIRVGAPLPAPVLRWTGRASLTVYMTACNPRSLSLPAAENARRLAQLRAQLRERDCRYLEGAGHVPGEHWREPSLLIRQIDEVGVDELACTWEQNAILIVRKRSAVGMRIYRPDWQRVLGDVTDIEWAGTTPR